MPSSTRSVLPRLAAVGALAVLATTISVAHAQSSSAIAEQLFLDGQKLMDAGRYPEACAKYTDSQRLDPAIGTLMNLAACHQKMGKNATAWSEFTDVAAQAQKAGQLDREKYARDHAAALDGKLQKVIIELSHPPPGTTIKLDGAALPSGVLGTGDPFDPGDHALEVAAPGKRPWTQSKLNLGPSAVVSRVQVTLEDDASAPGPAPGPDGGPGGSGAQHEQPAGADNPTKRVIGFGLGGLGVASVVVAVAEEVTSTGRSSDESKYPAGSSQRQTVADQSSTAQAYAIAFGAAGLAAIGAGVYLILTAHDAAPAGPAHGGLTLTPLIGPNVAGAGVHVVW